MSEGPFRRAVPDQAAYERRAQAQRRDQLEKATDAYFAELIDELQQGDPHALRTLLDFFSGKVTRWSARNLLAIRVQKPDIQRAVTPSEIKAHGHRLKRGAKPASIWVPVCEGAAEQREHQRAVARQVKWAQQAGIDLREVPALWSEYEAWKGRQLQEVEENRETELAAGGVVAPAATDADALQQATSLEAFLQSVHPDVALDETKAGAALLILQAARDRVGAFDPDPPQEGARVGWALSACVYDLGKDTEGPPLDPPGTRIDLEEGARFLEAVALYARSKGVEVTTEAGGRGQGESGAVAVYRTKGGKKEEKIYLARWSGLTTRCSTALHEVAHYLAGHHRIERAKGEEAQRRQSEPEEQLAEATAYVVGRQFGIPVEYSAAYLQHWGATPADLQRQLTAVRSLAKDMVVGIEEQLELLRRERQQAARRPEAEPAPAREVFVRCRGRLYDESQVAELMLALGSLKDPQRERVALLHNVAAPGEPARFRVVERLAAKDYQTRLLVEFAEEAREAEGARLVWVEPDGNFNYGFTPEEVPEGVQAVEVGAPEGKNDVTVRP